MRTTKEAEINVALLQYIMKCRSAGDDEALAHLGLARQEAETVESLSWGDLEHLSTRFHKYGYVLLLPLFGFLAILAMLASNEDCRVCQDTASLRSGCPDMSGMCW